MDDRNRRDGAAQGSVEIEKSEQGLSRRELIKGVGAAGIALAIPAGIASQSETAEAAPPPPEGASFKSFTPAEGATMSAIVERVIPTDENGPGAIAAGVPVYIDRLLASVENGRYGPLNPDRTLSECYESGLKAVDAYAQKTHGAPFVSLSPEIQDAILTEMQANKATGFTPDSRAFFNLIHSHTTEGFFCDPYYGGNANFIGWNLTNYPGTKLAYTAEEQTFGGKITIVRKSFMDYAVFAGSNKGI
jgi:gluconate 2-dehydrogenase gamma chain